jgi:hypothetical protein
MNRAIRPVLVLSAAVCLLFPGSAPLGAHDSLTPGAGEIVLSQGIMEGNYLLSGAVRKSVTRCMDIGGTAVAVLDYHSRSEFLFTTEMRYGLWYCCIPDYYVNYLYFSAGAGSYSEMGLGARENAFALSYGAGLRFNLFDVVILDAELKAFSLFKDGGRQDRLAFTVGGGLPL